MEDTDIRDEIKAIITQSGWKLNDLVKQLSENYGWSNSVSNLSNKLSKGTLKYREAKEIAEVIGYSIHWMPYYEVNNYKLMEIANRVFATNILDSVFNPNGAPRSQGRKPGGIKSQEPSE